MTTNDHIERELQGWRIVFAPFVLFAVFLLVIGARVYGMLNGEATGS